MILDLLPEGSPFLKESVPSFQWDADAEQIARDLGETMLAHRALGLAANQVGLPHRVFVMATPEGWYRACFNPSVDVLGEPVDHPEACLSFPGLELRISRPSTVFLRWTDEKKIDQSAMLTGYDAFGALHEIDHLNGVTFDTHVSRLVLSMAKKKRAKRR